MIELFVDATHLYPGATGRLETGGEDLPTDGTARFVSVVFADGMSAGAELVAGRTWTLDVARHRTAAGTDIDAKSWSLALFDRPDGIVLRITGRLPGETV